MSTSTPESSPTPKLKSSHGREPSETNQTLPPPTLRLVKDEEDIDIYSATPYPTKPEHILPPPSSGQQGGIYPSEHDNGQSEIEEGVSYTFQDPTSSVESFREPFGGLHGSSVSALSSIGQGGAASSSSQVWLEDANSSNTSVGYSPIRQTSEEDDEGVVHGSDRGDITLPPATHLTIKTVPPDSSPQSTPSPPATTVHHTPPSNSSSPNLIPLASSSPNLVPVASSSPNIVRTQSSDSSLYSANSVGTARRYTQQSPSRPIASYIYSDIEGSSSQSIPSSPPSAALRTYQSTSSLGLPPPETTFARARDSPNDPPKEDTPSSSDVQSVSSSGVHVQYPTVRAPSSTGSLAETSSTPPPPPQQASQSMTERSGRWNPHLSTVPSEWSAERQLSIPSTSNAGLSNDGRVKTPRSTSWNPSRPSIAVVDDSEAEHSDYLGTLLPVIPGARPVSAPSSSTSRLSSLKTINRPGSSASSGFFHIIPSWAHVYYKSGGLALHLSALSLVEGSRPSTAATEATKATTRGNGNGNVQIMSPMPAQLARPRTRIQQQDQQEQAQQEQAQPHDPRDPRAHWRDGIETQEAAPATPSGPDIDPITWSPHLLPDRHESVQKNPWKPPSLDEVAEGVFTWRNAQIYAFCLGFIFPLGMSIPLFFFSARPHKFIRKDSELTVCATAWLMASFFPLPPAANPAKQEASTSRPDLENALQSTVSSTDLARYESTRWWRKVNRLLTPVGLAIIAVVVRDHPISLFLAFF